MTKDNPYTQFKDYIWMLNGQLTTANELQPNIKPEVERDVCVVAPPRETQAPTGADVSQDLS